MMEKQAVNFNDIAIPKGASNVGWLDPDRRIDFTIVLSPKTPLPSIHAADSAHPSRRPAYLTHADLRHSHGSHSGAVELIQSFAHKFKLQLIEQVGHGRGVQLSGRAADISRAFNTRLEEFELDGHTFFFPVRPLNAPAEWKGVVEAVLGLHNSRQSWPRRHSAVIGHATSARLHDLARAYAFPAALNGTGQTIGLIEFGGGFNPQDIEQFCKRVGVPTPRITVVGISGGASRPASRRAIHQFLDVVDGSLTLAAKAERSDPFLAAQCTAEVTMDIEIIAALASAARIVVYFAPVDGQGLYRAVNYAVHDEVHRPDVLSVSWSVPEHSLSHSEVQAIEGVLHEAAHLGITVCASSGDAGALNGSADGTPSVNYPASSPHCLACGGTSGKIDPAGISQEVVWNATHYGIKGASGGGISEHFHMPAWQKDANVPAGPEGRSGRGVPDVAGLADPRYGCELLIAGRPFASAGTSAVAPMWAALIARMNQALGHRCGHLHPHIYRLGKERRPALRPVIKGDNGLYRAGKGWNACTGYGTPRGDELLAHLKKESLPS
jgi:kumamolisin